MKKMDRNLDGVYFRIKRGDHYDNICFSDLTKTERENVLSGKSIEWVKSLCYSLADSLKEIGDQFNIVKKMEA